MAWIHAGAHWINTDNITYIEDWQNSDNVPLLVLNFTVTTNNGRPDEPVNPGPDQLFLDGENRETVLAWLHTQGPQPQTQLH